MDSSNGFFSRRAILFTTITAFVLVVFWTLPSGTTFVDLENTLSSSKNSNDPDSWCPLPGKLAVYNDGLKPSFHFANKSSVERQVKRLSAAVNVPTVSYGDNGDILTDPRYETFRSLHNVLTEQFHLVDDSLKPILFAAHQDVVPANSPEKWRYQPFEAHFDGQYVWGRGASDCKNNLVGIMSVVESLLEQNWKPKRTILLAFGFDEEVGGERGAKYISQELVKRYGQHGVAMVMDEGGMGVEISGNHAYALPAVAEKGFLDIHLTLEVTGGHSSQPPAHSGIGIMAEMVVALEANPFKPRLTKENPFRGYLECQVRYSPQNVEAWLREALTEGKDEVSIGSRLADSRGNEVRFSMQTSQAVDVIKAGEATNPLPEIVTTIVNYRIAPHDSINSVKEGVSKLLAPIANKYGLAIKGFGTEDQATEGQHSLILTSTDDLSPSPISPTSPDNKVWNIFGGTIREVFEDIDSLKGKTVVPVGDIMTGNTDTIHYWDVSRNIYRFSPARAGTRMGIHTIDERIDINAHIEGMRVYYDLMRNFDNADV